MNSLRRLLPILLSLICLELQGAQAPKPNVILIMADDLGYETIGANGGTSYRTPALDELAATGTRFTHCYAQPLCTPHARPTHDRAVKCPELHPAKERFGQLSYTD